jgi:hypothetical protein
MNESLTIKKNFKSPEIVGKRKLGCEAREESGAESGTLAARASEFTDLLSPRERNPPQRLFFRLLLIEAHEAVIGGRGNHGSRKDLIDHLVAIDLVRPAREILCMKVFLNHFSFSENQSQRRKSEEQQLAFGMSFAFFFF